MIRRRNWSLAFVVSGAILAVIGLQALAYERFVGLVDERSQAQLGALRLEVVDNREANAGLRALQEVWEASNDEARRREFIALRDRVSERFLMDREAAMADFVDTVSALEPSGELDVLKQHSERLSGIYVNRSADALAFVDRPPWFLQPTASFLGDEWRSRFQFNAALHALLVGELESALEQLVQLRQQDGSARQIARIDYALARVHFARFVDEQAVDGFGQSLDLVEESLRRAPDQQLSLLLLDFLLAIDSSASLAEMETAEGQGSGQGDGERGALSNSSREF